MADINSITNAAQYRGTAELGGATGVGVILDSSPLQRLANFTYYRDKDIWEQKQKDDALAAKNIANIAAFDITTPLPQFSDALKSQLSDIQSFIRENPDALVYGRSPQKYQQLNEKINKFSKLRSTATGSDAVFNARKTAIDKETDPLKRSVMQEELDLDVKEYVAGGAEAAIGKTLKSAPDLKIEDFQIPLAKITEYTVIDEGPNKDIKNKFKFVNLDQAAAESQYIASGAMPGTIDENADWFKALSPERQALERKKRSISSQERQKIRKLSLDFNGLLKQYQETNPDKKLSDISGETTGDTLLDNIKWANAINTQIDQLNGLIAGGTLKDPTGRVITKHYEKLNLEDGLAEWEIILMNTIQNSKTPLWSLDKEITQTDNALQEATRKDNAFNDRRQNEIAKFNAETGRINANKGVGSAAPGLEAADVMDLTGYTGKASSLSISDMAAINPTFVTSENGVLKLSDEGIAARSTIKILPNGDVVYKEDEETTVDGKTVTKAVERTIPKDVYQKQAVTHVQTILKDRKGETGNPFTNTRKKAVAGDDSTLTDAEYFLKYKKARTK